MPLTHPERKSAHSSGFFNTIPGIIYDILCLAFGIPLGQVAVMLCSAPATRFAKFSCKVTEIAHAILCIMFGIPLGLIVVILCCVIDSIRRIMNWCYGVKHVQGSNIQGTLPAAGFPVAAPGRLEEELMDFMSAYPDRKGKRYNCNYLVGE